MQVLDVKYYGRKKELKNINHNLINNVKLDLAKTSNICLLYIGYSHAKYFT